ncbi:hypothetical protein [Neptunicella sp. SCSIO 80796]|uniref:hypothetical protein n=1 Tax=Neptunicella plasticusilytica TaxID=3117012 RepID=UPI003A4D6109
MQRFTTFLTVQFFGLLLTGFHANASDENLSDRINNRQQITLNLAVTSSWQLEDVEPGQYEFQIVNLLPGQRDKYKININKENLFPSALKMPEKLKAKDTKEGGEKAVQGQEEGKGIQQNVCDKPNEKTNALSEKIYQLTDEAALPEYINELTGINPPSACIEARGRIATLIAATMDSHLVTFSKHQKVTISVQRGENTLTTLVLEDKPTEWLTHVGFTFLNNKDEYFYSEKVPGSTTDAPATYKIARGTQRDDISYAATAMFTYPFASEVWGEDIDIGFSVGLGTDKNSIAALIGLSAIINDNFMITAGVIGSQFDVLKRDYKVGQDIGETAIDSSNLVQKTYKFPLMVTFSYKFGE